MTDIDDAPLSAIATASPSTTTTNRWIVWAAVGTLVVPVALDLAVSGKRRLFAYPAADAFYYLRVADVWAHTGHVSFDGTRSTNGFHPLWQFVEVAFTRVGITLGWSRLTNLAVALLLGLV